MNFKNKNLAIAIPSLGMGGAERVVSELANEFVQLGINVNIIMLDKNEVCYQIDKRVKIHFIDCNKNKDKFLRNRERIKDYKEILNKERIDVVLSFLTSANFLSILATRGTDIKVYVSERSNPNVNTKIIKIVRNILYMLCDGLICQTKDAKDYFPNCIRKKGKVIKNPIKENLPCWLDIQEHEKYIITAVRLEKSKNISLLLQAFFYIEKQYKDYKLLIYGDGPEYKNIAKKINELQLEDKVILKGRSNEWHKQAVRSEIFVLPSDYEGMSNSLLEALAMGMPVISTDHPIGGAREVIENGKNGFLVPIKDADSLSKRLAELIENKELQKSFSKEAQKIKQTMNIKIIAKEWLEFIFKK